jgi:predicted  nucleic acid-binding Zn-ribbon protein
MIELSNIDNDINKFEPEIERIKDSYSKTLLSKEEVEGDIAKTEDKIRDFELKKTNSEEYLQNLSEDTKKSEKKLKEVKNEKELESLKIEDNVRKEQITYANEEIARYEGLLQSKGEELEEKKEKLKTVSDEVDVAKAEMEKRLEAVTKNRENIYIDRENLVNSMDKKIYSFYGKIRRWAKDTTVVPVKNGACYGCFIKLSDQNYLEVMKGDEIITCPNCGRLLYLESHLEREEEGA